MKIYKQDNDYTIYQGDSFEVLDTLEEKSIDAIVTDPPYGLTSITKRFGKENSSPAQEGKDGSFARLSKGFMGKTWDGTGIEYNVEFWEKCFKVLKPGGYLLAFGGTRTFHRIACAIEEAGFEIRDTLMWLYGSGFPKSQNVGFAVDKKLGQESIVIGRKKGTGNPGKNNNGACVGFTSKNQYEDGTYDIKIAQNEYAGYGTCLKPAYEPIIMARKPIEGTVADNMLKYGVGGINIDECRVGEEYFTITNGDYDNNKNQSCFGNIKRTPKEYQGRFPANVITDGSDEVKANMPNTNGGNRNNFATRKEDSSSYGGKAGTINTRNEYDDEGSACRYFYCAKASKKDRDEGLEEFNEFYTLKEDTPQEIRESILKSLTI